MGAKEGVDMARRDSALEALVFDTENNVAGTDAMLKRLVFDLPP